MIQKLQIFANIEQHSGSFEYPEKIFGNVKPLLHPVVRVYTRKCATNIDENFEHCS